MVRRYLLFLFGSTITFAFGPTFEVVKGGLGAGTSRKAFAGDENEESGVYLGTRKPGYSLHFENRFEEIDGEYIQSRFFISEPFILDASMFGIVNPYDILGDGVDGGAFAACGEDCEECAIPEEYKQIENPVDVMAYLGIRRAEPIRATVHRTAGDWE